MLNKKHNNVLKKKQAIIKILIFSRNMKLHLLFKFKKVSKKVFFDGRGIFLFEIHLENPIMDIIITYYRWKIKISEFS